MAATKGLGTTGNGAGVVTSLDHKLAQAGLLVKTGAGTNLVRPGLFFDGVTNIVTGTAGMSYNVAAFTCATTRGGAAGAVLLTNDGTVNVVTTAAPGSNSRIDIVYIWPREFLLDGTDSNPVIGVKQGIAAASPVAPTLTEFPGAIELARITVAAGATATNGAGVTITQTAPFTAPAGGVVAFRNAVERNAATLAEGTLAHLLDTEEQAYSTGAGWQSLSPIFARRQLDTTNDSGRFLIQHGVGKIVGNNTATITEVVTFPVAFAVVPTVIVTTAGGRTAGSFNMTGLSSASSAIPSQSGVTTSQFEVALRAFTGTLANTTDWYYTWMAIGVAA